MHDGHCLSHRRHLHVPLPHYLDGVSRIGPYRWQVAGAPAVVLDMQEGTLTLVLTP